jgi:uncharacterized membrane protein YqiK
MDYLYWYFLSLTVALIVVSVVAWFASRRVFRRRH